MRADNENPRAMEIPSRTHTSNSGPASCTMTPRTKSDFSWLPRHYPGCGEDLYRIVFPKCPGLWIPDIAEQRN